MADCGSSIPFLEWIKLKKKKKSSNPPEDVCNVLQFDMGRKRLQSLALIFPTLLKSLELFVLQGSHWIESAVTTLHTPSKLQRESPYALKLNVFYVQRIVKKVHEKQIKSVMCMWLSCFFVFFFALDCFRSCVLFDVNYPLGTRRDFFFMSQTEKSKEGKKEVKRFH